MRSPLLLAILSAIGCAERSEGTACMAVETAECPAPEDVDLADLSDTSYCDHEVVEMVSTETPEPGSSLDSGVAECCYEVVEVDRSPNSECMVGRPFLEDGEAVLPSHPFVADPVAAAWARLAGMEWASVAAFARLTLKLLAHGAPQDLVDRVAAAMRDEIDHAERLRRHAEGLSGRALPFGPMPFPHPVAVRRDLATLAAEAVREGCLGETISAQLVAEASARAEDPALREDLAAIAADEQRHAVLSWAIVAWAMREGGGTVRRAVREAFADPTPVGVMVRRDGHEDEGLLGPTASEEVARRTLLEVIVPAARAMDAA